MVPQSLENASCWSGTTTTLLQITCTPSGANENRRASEGATEQTVDSRDSCTHPWDSAVSSVEQGVSLPQVFEKFRDVAGHCTPEKGPCCGARKHRHVRSSINSEFSGTAWVPFERGERRGMHCEESHEVLKGLTLKADGSVGGINFVLRSIVGAVRPRRREGPHSSMK